MLERTKRLLGSKPKDNPREELVDILYSAIELLSLPDNGFLYSHWDNEADAVGEIKALLSAIERGNLPDNLEVSLLFAPTGPIQEVSLCSGWSEEFIKLSDRFDSVEQILWDPESPEMNAEAQTLQSHLETTETIAEDRAVQWPSESPEIETESEVAILAHNLASNELIVVECGFLIVKAFAQLHVECTKRYDLRHARYSIPRIDGEAIQSTIQYRGLDREALNDQADSVIDAEVNLAILAMDNRAVNGIIFSLRDLEETFGLLGTLQSEYEIVWVRIAGSKATPPDGYIPIGFEPNYFVSDHFCPHLYCMPIPRRHCKEKEEELFLSHLAQLNPYGLFNTVDAARAFLQYYTSLDWTETGEYVIAEVFIKQ